MAMKLSQLLYEANKGYCLEIVNQKEFGKKEALSKYEKALKKCLGNSSNSQWETAITIAKFVRSGSWAAYHDETSELYDKWREDNPGAKCSDNPYGPIGGAWWSDNSIYLLTFMKEKFGICRTTLYNYIEVVDEFTTYVVERGKEPEYRIGVEAKFFQFWQLVEMLPLTYQERTKVEPNWTRAEIRAYKKSLRDKENKIQPAEQIEAEEKPLTEAQQRFANYSKDDLIKLVVELEKANETNKLEVERILASPISVEDVLPLKHELTDVIEKLLKAYPYEIHLHGRKQGVKAFAGVLAKNIIESCKSENESDLSMDINSGELIQEKFAV